MNWKIILLLTLVGVVIAIGSVFGLIKSNEWIFWLVLAFVSGFVVAKTCNRVFMHGVMIGLFSGILTSVIQAVMFDTYLENNPSSLDGFKDLPVTLAPQYVVLFSGPFFGIAYGIVVGLIAIVISKFAAKKIA